MLRESRARQKPEHALGPKKDGKARFQIVKLEERIAPKCNTNPRGREVGNCPISKG